MSHITYLCVLVAVHVLPASTVTGCCVLLPTQRQLLFHCLVMVRQVYNRHLWWWVWLHMSLLPLAQGPAGPVGRPAPEGKNGNKVGRSFFSQFSLLWLRELPYVLSCNAVVMSLQLAWLPFSPATIHRALKGRREFVAHLV